MTEDLAPTTTFQDIKAIRAYEIFERLRQGESLPEIAEALGITRQAAQGVVKELASYARQSTKDLAATTFLTADLRLNDLYRRSFALASDPTADHDVQLKGIATCLAIQTKINDLHQVGRANQSGASSWVNLDDMTDAEIIKSARQIGIPIPKEIAEAGGFYTKEDRL